MSFKILFLFAVFSSKKDKSEGQVEVTHVLFEEPIYAIQEPVFYPAPDPTYDIAPVTSSHPQSSSLGTYGDMSIYGSGISTYDSIIGPPVPPPTSTLKGTYSEISEEFYSDDGDD